MSRLKEVLSKLAKDYQENIQRQIVIEKLKSSGNLRNSIQSELTKDGFTITSNAINAYLLGDKGYKPKNKGSREDKKEKLERIKTWMKSKGIRPYSKLSSGGTRFRKLKNEDKQYNQAAFFINRSMNRRGSIKRYKYKGSDIIKRVYDMQKAKTTEEITLAFRKDIVDGIKSEFKFDNLKIQ